MSTIIVALLLQLFSDGMPPPAVANVLPRPAHPIMADEEFLYEVSWTVFKIGTIRIKTIAPGEARAWIDSYDGIPFVDLHSVYHCVMDSLLFSRGASTVDKVNEAWEGFRYTPEEGSSRVFIDRIAVSDPVHPPARTERLDTITLPQHQFVDGLTIGYLPRAFIHTNRTLEVITVLNGKTGTTTFEFTGRHMDVAIDALERPVKVVEVRGSTSATGIFGMSGEFTGWFSDDEAGVPIKGEVKVLLGNVTVELIQWRRDGWQPPT